MTGEKSKWPLKCVSLEKMTVNAKGQVTIETDGSRSTEQVEQSGNMNMLGVAKVLVIYYGSSLFVCKHVLDSQDVGTWHDRRE